MRLARPDERRRYTMAERTRWGSADSPGAGYATLPNTSGLALLGWQSGAFKCRPRDRWIGWRQREQFHRLHLI